MAFEFKKWQVAPLTFWHTDSENWAVEAKHYRTARAQMSLIESAAIKLVNRGIIASAWKGMLVVSSTMLPATREELEQKYSLLFVDRADLITWAAKHPALLDELHAVLEGDAHDEARDHGRSPSAINNVDPLPSEALPSSTLGSDLSKELHNLKRGRASWSAYEKLCDRILRYLFPNDLQGWHKQKRTEDGFSRYDYVCRIKSDTDFWRFVMDHLHSRYILFEFKNYAGKIKQGQVLTTEKYLLEMGLRRAAIIMTRAGADKGARAMIQGAMREHGKLMLVLDDTQICKMLDMKENGEDPTDLLFDVADDFLLSLPR